MNNNFSRAALAAALVGIGGSAFAQNATVTERNNPNSPGFDVAAGRVQSPRRTASSNSARFDITPILQRAAQLRQAAQSKTVNRATVASARTAYQGSVSAFDKMFAISGRGGASTSATSAFVSVSSAQGEEDIRLLRFAMQQNKNPKLQQIAELYAAAINQFFTAQLRDALYGKDFEPRSSVVLKGLPARTNIILTDQTRTGSQNTAGPTISQGGGGSVLLPQGGGNFPNGVPGNGIPVIPVPADQIPVVPTTPSAPATPPANPQTPPTNP